MPMQCVVIGDVNRTEFAGVLESVREHSECRAFATLCECRRWLEDAASRDVPILPVLDLIVVLHSYDGEHSQSEYDAVAMQYPFSPVVSVIGTWCEGESRTGLPLFFTRRIYWYEWFPQGYREFLNWKNGTRSLFRLPPTMKDEEIVLERERQRPTKTSAARNAPAFPTRRNRAWIVSERELSSCDPAMTRLFFEILRRERFAPKYHEGINRFPESASPEIVLWDLGPEPVERTLVHLKMLRARIPSGRIVLFAMSPRIDERERLLRCGADCLFAKPFDLHDLTDVLHAFSYHLH